MTLSSTIRVWFMYIARSLASRSKDFISQGLYLRPYYRAYAVPIHVHKGLWSHKTTRGCLEVARTRVSQHSHFGNEMLRFNTLPTVLVRVP